MAVGRRYRLPWRKFDIKIDSERSARRALNYGQSLGNSRTRADIPAVVTYRRDAVNTFATDVARNVFVAPIEASAKITTTRITRRSSRVGRIPSMGRLKAMMHRAVVSPRVSHRIVAQMRRLVPKVQTAEINRRYRIVITIDQRTYRLRLFRNWKLVRSYGVAVGTPSYPTPKGNFHVINKTVNPDWTGPRWAGAYAGRFVRGGAPDNPLKARWLGIGGGVGIHGTAARYSIGSRASHGCVRMLVEDVIDLYKRTPVGTPVYVR